MMQVKSVKLLSIIVMILITLLMVAGCGKSGNRFANYAPTIKITSFEGWDSTYVSAGYDTTLTYTFQQRIYWNATDPDGVIAGYAFRVLDDNNMPVATPGYHYIDTLGELTPQSLLAIGNGWVIHYLPGANQEIPLDSPEAARSIWTSQKYAVINFPSADAIGNPITKFSRFEVVAIDNRGAITAQPAWRNFKTTSERPKCMITTTKGNPNGKQVGAGIKLHFSMEDFDPFIAAIPFKYEFNMMKTNLNGTSIIPGTETGWISTDSDDAVTDDDLDRIYEFLLTSYTTPALEYDFDDAGIAFRQTRISARVTDMAGVVSVPDSNTVLTFRVKQGFRPKALIWPTKTYALGNNHYEDWGDDSTPETIPNTISQGAIRYATPFFKDIDGKLTAVYSNNIKVWVRWGWWGEYGNVTGESSVDYGDTTNLNPMPYNKKVDVVLDYRSSGAAGNYFSEITAFHLRFDNQPYNFPPYAESIVTDNEGLRWLRIPVNSPLGQTVVLTSGQLPLPNGTEPGEHTFQVKVEDLQGETDPTPASFKFYLHNYIEPANRDGILIIDDDTNHPSYSPDAIVAAKYESMLSDYNGTKTYIKRSTLATPGNTIPDARDRHLAFSDLQKYKLVVYHSDNPASTGNLEFDVDGLVVYLLRGGNLVVSHTNNLAQSLSAISFNRSRYTFFSYLGLPINPVLGVLSSSAQTRAFFQNAVATPGLNYNDVHVQFDDPPSFNQLVNTFDGLSLISYIPTTTGEALYRLGCKPVGYPVAGPTQAQFDLYNNQIIGTRKVNTNNSKTYLMSFPLSYMLEADTKTLMNKIISEVM